MPLLNRHPKKKILFLVKRKNDSAGYSTFESGLHNSCHLTLEALIKHDLVRDGKVVVCTDGNSIDRELHHFKPDVCSIDAVWVTPKKLREVQRLHRKVKFVIRVHSNIPFLALEGNAIEWMKEYEKIPNVTVSFNNRNTNDYLGVAFTNPVKYLPNIYEATFRESSAIDGELHIGCFGALRPLKNQLLQAVAAIQFAESIDRHLHFHINGSRIEQSGEGVLKNLRALFHGTHHKLIEHRWLKHHEFMHVISRMDIGLQVSFTESFNIVSADFIYAGVPIVVSKDIDWMNDSAKVEATNAFEVVDKITEILSSKKRFLRKAQKALTSYNKDSIDVWRKFL